ncbi:DgyrCDS2084 [Dimorphilus gyrociliatus]|uniref:DgyrCDS2084 n=1 Tax=Dimorphilus gyrociliatus TaxID=2664684 RepID=A0A7I8VC04_9ANNE|nr:DgyrCDS2084 [Dimorphilus gyrociliatus]
MLALVCLLLTTTVLGEKIIDFEIYDATPANFSVGPLLSSGVREKKIILLKTHAGAEKNFTITPSGILKTKTTIDREAICPNKAECNMTLEAGILPAENFQSLTINLKIRDVNDNTPRFPFGRIKVKFSEAAEPGDYVTIPPASDPDSPRYSVQRYVLRNAVDRFNNKIFIHKLIKNKNVGLENLRIILNSRLDRELIESYTLQILAIDGGDSRRTGTLKVSVIVEDANDHEPVFKQSVYKATVLENITKNTPIVQVSASDKDSGDNGKVSYSWNSRTEQNYANTFRIDSKNGTIFPIVPLDFEDVQEYELYVLGTDSGSSPRFSQTKVIINLEDVNDNVPDVQIITLHDDRGYASVEENSKIGSFVAHVSITDQDFGDNGRVKCVIDDNVPFAMESGLEKQYQIVTTKQLNREKQSQYLITLKCKDFGKIPNVADRLIDVRVLDLNDNSPAFQEIKDHRGKILKKDQLQVAENASIGHVIARIRATDPDEGRNGSVIYTLKQIDRVSERLLEIDRRSGIIRVSKNLDREKYGRIRIRVKASDEGLVSKHTSIKLTVKILDVDDNLPKFGQESYEKSVYENRPIGTFVVLVSANDDDVKDKEVQLRFSRPQDYQIFDMDESGRITTKQIFDRQGPI